jgi:tetratricopeptide (TPR) repeat protein
MIQFRRQCALAATALTLAVASLTPAHAQDIGALVDNALKAMQGERWEEALELNKQAIGNRDPKQLKMLFSAKFGVIYYRKGVCEMKLQKWDEAMQSFDICHREFPNGKEAAAARENPFEKMALLRWAEAATGAGEWQTAIDKFLQFLKERHPTLDAYQQGPFHISMAICHYNLDKIEEGNKHLQTAIDNKLTFPTPDSLIVAAFQELVAATLRSREEAPLLDFISKNRGGLVVEPYLMQRYSKIFLKLTGDCVKAGLDGTALALLQFVPATETAIDDLRARLRAMGPLQRLNDGPNTLVRAELEQELAALEAERRGGKSNETIKLSVTAFVHERNGNVRGAHAAYLLLETFHSNADKREDNLFNLARTTSIVGSADDTRLYSEKFIAAYPDSRHIPSLRRIMLASLFYDGEYEQCIEIAEPMLDKLQPGTPEHDMCLHVLGGSYFFTARFEEAQPLLDEHVKQYPESRFAMAAAYFQASNLYRLGNWNKAGELLDAFIAKYPDSDDNEYLPLALFDRANCYSSLEQAEPALQIISRLVLEFPNASILDQAYILRGNIEQLLNENPERAEQAYLAALDTAVKLNHKNIAGEAIFWIINLIGQPESDRLKEAVPFADRFWSEFAEGSPFRSSIAISQFPALAEADRTDDGLDRLRQMIVEYTRADQTAVLEELIPSYTDAYLTKHTPEQLKDHFFDFPDIRPTDTAARALLRVSVIGVFEKVARESEDEKEKRSATALVKVLFQQLKTDFDLKQLSTSILVQLGDFLRLKTATPREAIPYYDAVLAREEAEFRFRALLGRAKAYADSSAPEDIDKALADFGTVYAESDDNKQDEEALYRIVELLVAKGDYAEAGKQALEYLDERDFKTNAAMVGMLLAQSFDKRKMMEDAISMYGQVWSGNNMGDIKISAPAIKRWMELSWQRNRSSDAPGKSSDRQAAYEAGAKYIKGTAPLKNQMTPDELKAWNEVEELVKTYEADPDIKTMAEIEKEKEAAGGLRLIR